MNDPHAEANAHDEGQKEMDKSVESLDHFNSNEQHSVQQDPDHIIPPNQYPPDDGVIFKGKAWRRMKIIMVIIGMGFNIVVRFGLPTEHVKCIMDKTHDWLGPVNSYLHQHSQFAFYLKLGFNLLVDVNIVTAMFHWVFYSKKWQFFFDLTVFFIVRFFCTHLIAYRNAEGNLWPETNVISISGTKMTEQQYQVSAYSGVLLIIALYWIQQLGLSLFGLALSIFVELSYRISYSTDIFAACLIAHLFHILNAKWVPQFDEYVNSKLIRYWALNKWINKKNNSQNGNDNMA